MEQNENKNVETAEATQVSHEETRKKLKKQRVRQIIASLIGVAILAFGLWKIVCLFLDYNSNETSNDAQIEQYISPVNLRASGYIAKVCFREHQEVHKGDTLLVLDDREYRIRLMEAEAPQGCQGRSQCHQCYRADHRDISFYLSGIYR